MRTNTNHEDRELSVQELETATGGVTNEQAQKDRQQQDKEQAEALKTFAQLLQGL